MTYKAEVARPKGRRGFLTLGDLLTLIIIIIVTFFLSHLSGGHS